MHELSIVFHVIDEVKEIAKENQVSRVKSVTLQIGEVSMVIPEMFQDCWKWAVEKTDCMKGCQAKIEIIKGISYCEDCGCQYETTTYAKVCPQCGSDHTYLLQGNEFILKEIEVYEDDPS